jgi:hypothetical protein
VAQLQPLAVQIEVYTTCDDALEVYGIQGVDQVLDKYLTRPEGGGVAEHKATFFNALKAARKYMCQIDNNNNTVVMFNEVENELYRQPPPPKQDSLNG